MSPVTQFWALMGIILAIAIAVVLAGVVYYHFSHRRQAVKSREHAERRLEEGREQVERG